MHRTKAQREEEIMSTPENVRLRAEAAARCTAKIKRIVLRRQARKAGAERLVKCSLEPGKEKAKNKPLTELHVKGHFTKDREECQKKLQRQHRLGTNKRSSRVKNSHIQKERESTIY